MYWIGLEGIIKWLYLLCPLIYLLRHKIKKAKEFTEKPIKKKLPNFNLSGKLLEDTNLVNGSILKYSEPRNKAIPDKIWTIFV